MKEIPVYRFFKHKYGPELLVDVVDMKRMAPGIRRTPTYIQTFFALMLVAEGEQRVEVNGRGMAVGRGMVICARPGEVWSWDDEAHVEALTLAFEEEFLLSFFNDPHFIEHFPYLCAGRLSPFLLLTEPLYNRTLTLLQEMRTEINQPSGIDQHILRAMLYEALMLFSRAETVEVEADPLQPAAAATAMGDTGQDRYTEAFVRLVNEHYTHEHSTDFYASRLCITPGYLNKIARQSLGLSAKAYISSRILQEARRLLRYTTLTVQEIASRLGFDTATYFVRFFGKHEGMTPLEYRAKTNNQ